MKALILIKLSLLACSVNDLVEALGPLSSRSAFTRNTFTSLPVLDHQPSGNSPMTMRDVSASYWFRVGDSVRVVDDVYKSNVNLKGRVGKVCETWEKCEVDPTCCCAEQVDVNMAVRVVFESSPDGETLEHHFAETELTKVDEE